MLIAALTLLVLALAIAGPASAAKPCWREVLDDWTDNARLDKEYEIRCYDQALENLPGDIRDYTDAFDQISDARQAALRGDDLDRQTSEFGAPGGNDDDPDASGDGPLDTALGVGSGDSDSIPIPLLVLAGLAGLLMTAGAAGLLARKLQARRANTLEPPE
jgi:hypothetical protein